MTIHKINPIIAVIVAMLLQSCTNADEETPPTGAPATATLIKTEAAPLAATATAAPVSTNTAQPTVTGDGSADFQLVWDRNSLTLIIKGRTHLGSLALNILNRNERETRHPAALLFPELDNQNFVVDTSGVCLNAYRRGEAPTLPESCTGEVFQVELVDSDIFWYDNAGNALRSIIVRHGTDSTICSAALKACNVRS